MTRSHRRGMFLIELLPVLLAVAVGGTVMTMSIASILRSQRRVAELSNRYAVFNDFLRCFRQDVRSAGELTLVNDDRDDSVQVLVVGHGQRKITYRFLDEGVARIGYEKDPVADKQWTFENTDFSLALESAPDELGPLVKLTIWWRRTAKKDPEPSRRFDVTIRCAGELRDE